MRRHLFVLYSVIWMIVIFIGSSLPGDQLGPDTCIINGVKKMGHSVVYAILAGLYLWAFKREKTLSETRFTVFALSFVLAVLYAVTDEYHQSFTPGRHATVRDVLIDSGGAIVCLGALYGMRSKKRR